MLSCMSPGTCKSQYVSQYAHMYTNNMSAAIQALDTFFAHTGS